MSRFRHLVAILSWLGVLGLVAWLAVPGFYHADEALYSAAAEQPGKPLRLLFPGQEPRDLKVLTPYHVPEYPTVLFTVWDSELDQSPAPAPKLQELSTILHCLATRHGVRLVALSSPLSWADEDNEMVHLMFEHALQSLQHLSVGLQAYNAVQAQITPSLLQGCAIPPDNLTGDSVGLPTANMARPYHLPHQVNDTVNLAPDFVEDELLGCREAEQRGLSLPLLMRWNDDILPTLPLSIALRHLGLSPADIHVHFGHSLRLGKNIFPLDAHGRTPLGAARAEQLPLYAALRPATNASQPHNDASSVIAVLFRPSVANGSTNRGELIAATISCLLAQNRTTYLPGTRTEQAYFLRLTPLQATPTGLSCLVLLTLAALILLPRLPILPRLTLMIAGLAGIWLLAWLSFRAGLWISLCAWLSCWLLLFVALSALAPRHGSPPPPTLWD